MFFIFGIFLSAVFWAFLPVSLSRAAESPPSRLVHDFDSGSLVNDLGGGSGTWILDPHDERQSCIAGLEDKNAWGGSGHSLKIDYDLDSPAGAQGGFWTQLLGSDLSEFDHLEFYARAQTADGSQGRMRIEFKKSREPGSREKVVGSYMVNGIDASWKKISIPLNTMTGLADNWNDIEELVFVLKDRMLESRTGTIYLDDIRLVKTGNPGPSISDPVPRKSPKQSDIYSGEERARMLAARLKGFPRKTMVDKNFSPDAKEFLMEVARDTWGYFRDIVDRSNGLPLDNIAYAEDLVMGSRTVIGDYTNVTNIGLYLLCIVAAHDLGFIKTDEAITRIGQVLDSLERMESYQGFLYNYYDTTTFERTSHFISFVDEGWLTIGIMVARNAFRDTVGRRCEDLLKRRDFSFFYDAVEGQMYHGFYTNMGVYSEYHYGAFYTEPRAISFMAIGREQAPLEHWFRMERTLSGDYAWQSQTPKARVKKSLLGCEFMGGYYVYRDQPYVPSWGGSMFEALMPALVVDEKGLSPEGLGLNGRRHVEVQIQYALEDLGYPVWGLSPCSVPPGEGYAEYGAAPLGMNPYGQGVVTPHASFLALEFAPDEAVKNLRKLLELYPIYGEYGFYDAVDVKTGTVSYKYLCLDQAMSFIAMANFLKDGAIRKRFMSDPMVDKAKGLLTSEKLFE